MSTQDSSILDDPFGAEAPVKEQIDAFPDLPTAPPVETAADAEKPKATRKRKPKTFLIGEVITETDGAIDLAVKPGQIEAKNAEAAIEHYVTDNEIKEQGRTFIALPADALDVRRTLAVTVGLV